MLYGADPQIYTDHKNLIFANFTTQRVLRWRCFIEEFHPRLFYIEGKNNMNNILADAFSRLPRHANPNRVVHDGGPELKANSQTYVTNEYQVKTVQTTAHTLHASLCDLRAHASHHPTIDQHYCDLNRPWTREDARAIVDRALSYASHARVFCANLADPVSTGFLRLSASTSMVMQRFAFRHQSLSVLISDASSLIGSHDFYPEELHGGGECSRHVVGTQYIASYLPQRIPYILSLTLNGYRR
ncbi:hypothetical protein THAOC_35557 [Thalassiosira oceanica]|uniref:Reverse transcriptase RNase H-like domain-containing protein n=1 Tax=Thalassiosira oceanica TaxID=159749 RepID=K0R1K0_THAOC|nr:hypothetical protein THAOC_35557 [Thalassiosira oceanica]|eukprot:EJK45810.1 hypothetical protein THAOC_35557 [Thalassiosira oceanica]